MWTLILGPPGCFWNRFIISGSRQPVRVHSSQHKALLIGFFPVIHEHNPWVRYAVHTPKRKGHWHLPLPEQGCRHLLVEISVFVSRDLWDQYNYPNLYLKKQFITGGFRNLVIAQLHVAWLSQVLKHKRNKPSPQTSNIQILKIIKGWWSRGGGDQDPQRIDLLWVRDLLIHLQILYELGFCSWCESTEQNMWHLIKGAIFYFV